MVEYIIHFRRVGGQCIEYRYIREDGNNWGYDEFIDGGMWRKSPQNVDVWKVDWEGDFFIRFAELSKVGGILSGNGL